MNTVLLVGDDEMLQFTRAALLRTLGAETVCCWGSDAPARLRERQFDLVVLCHSLPERLSASLTEKIHASWPNTPVLRVVAREWEVVENAGSDGMVSSGNPESLILHAKKLLQADHGDGHARWQDGALSV